MKAYEIESQTDFRQRELTICQAEYNIQATVLIILLAQTFPIIYLYATY